MLHSPKSPSSEEDKLVIIIRNAQYPTPRCALDFAWRKGGEVFFRTEVLCCGSIVPCYIRIVIKYNDQQKCTHFIIISEKPVEILSCLCRKTKHVF